MWHFSVPRALQRTYRVFSLYFCHHLFIVICKGSSYNLKNVYNACSIRKMVFLTIESANKTEKNIFSAPPLNRPEKRLITLLHFWVSFPMTGFCLWLFCAFPFVFKNTNPSSLSVLLNVDIRRFARRKEITSTARASCNKVSLPYSQ